MSVTQIDKIDFISLREGTNSVVLTISDHLDWTDTDEHLQVLQDKINTYLNFCESGEIFESYPKAKDKDIVIEIKGKYPLNCEGNEFYEHAKSVIREAGFELVFKLVEKS